jgi:hypothetical protein
VTPWARIQVEMASIYCLSCVVGLRRGPPPGSSLTQTFEAALHPERRG